MVIRIYGGHEGNPGASQENELKREYGEGWKAFLTEHLAAKMLDVWIKG